MLNRSNAVRWIPRLRDLDNCDDRDFDQLSPGERATRKIALGQDQVSGLATYQPVAPNRDKFAFSMLSFDDKRWQSLSGGYRTIYDPRPLLEKLESNDHVKTAWHELWEELHHQGDVGEASYASVPHLVRIHRQRGVVDWNTYAIVAVIELARGKGNNPEIPEWLEREYFRAIQELAEIGAVEVLRAKEPEEIRAILSVLALAKDARIHARFLLEYSEADLLDIEKRARNSDS